MISIRLLLFGCLGVVTMIALPTVAGTNKVADMQMNFWREKLLSIPMLETVAASMSPLTEEEVNKYAKIIKDANLRSYATQFCKATNLLCHQPVEVVSPLLSWSRSNGPGNFSEEACDLFFSLKKLMEGEQITLPKLYSPWKSFLPHNLSELLPFSTAALSDVLSSFGIPKRSNMALDMNMTLIASEAKLPEGEIGKATTSIEGMIEYVLSNFGSSQSLELVSHPEPTADIGKKARIRNVNEILSGSSDRPYLGCHRLVYPYGVYYCHFVARTMTFTVQVEVENNGNVYNSTVLCHPRGLAQTQESIDCHLIVGDTLLWFSKENH